MDPHPWAVPQLPASDASDSMPVSGSSFAAESSGMRPKPLPINQKRQRQPSTDGLSHPIPLSDPDFHENAQLSRLTKRRLVADLLSMDLEMAMDITGSSPPQPSHSEAIPMAIPRSIAIPTHMQSSGGSMALGSPPIQHNQNLRKTALLRTLLKGQAGTNPAPSAMETGGIVRGCGREQGVDLQRSDGRGRLSISHSLATEQEAKLPIRSGGAVAMDVPEAIVNRGSSDLFAAASSESNMTEELSAIMGDCSSSDSDEEQQRQRMPLVPPMLTKSSVGLRDETEEKLKIQVDSLVAIARAGTRFSDQGG